MQRKNTKARLLPRLRVVCADSIALGPGKADLLTLIAKTGSIREAAARLGMSYMRAWTLVQTVNGSFRQPLVIAERGGQGRGGARLSLTGRQVLRLYRRMERACLAGAETSWRELSSLLRKP